MNISLINAVTSVFTSLTATHNVSIIHLMRNFNRTHKKETKFCEAKIQVLPPYENTFPIFRYKIYARRKRHHHKLIQMTSDVPSVLDTLSKQKKNTSRYMGIAIVKKTKYMLSDCFAVDFKHPAYKRRYLKHKEITILWSAKKFVCNMYKSNCTENRVSSSTIAATGRAHTSIWFFI